MTDHILTRAKAYAALIGGILTVVASNAPADPTLQKWLGIGLALATAVATFTVPNKPTQPTPGKHSQAGVTALEVCVFVITVIAVLWFFGVHAH